MIALSLAATRFPFDERFSLSSLMASWPRSLLPPRAARILDWGGSAKRGRALLLHPIPFDPMNSESTVASATCAAQLALPKRMFCMRPEKRDPLFKLNRTHA